MGGPTSKPVHVAGRYWNLEYANANPEMESIDEIMTRIYHVTRKFMLDVAIEDRSPINYHS